MWSVGGVRGQCALFVVCVLVLGCSGTVPDPRILTEPLLVDAELDSEQRADVQAAVDLWSDATEGRFAPQLVFGPVTCGESFAIEAVHTPACFVGQKFATSDGRILQVRGATDPDEHSVAVAAWLAGRGFRDTVAHELGHYLLLGHGEGIMSQREGRDSSEVAPSSISEFCDIWGC